MGQHLHQLFLSLFPPLHSNLKRVNSHYVIARLIVFFHRIQLTHFGFHFDSGTEEGKEISFEEEERHFPFRRPSILVENVILVCSI